MAYEMIEYLSTPNKPVTFQEFTYFWLSLSLDERRELFHTAGLTGQGSIYDS